MELFYGKAGCANCHSGPFQTDHDFHAIAMPQIGPGKRDGADGRYWRATGEDEFLEDFGRGRVTMRTEDRYRFRTPSLRNVVLSAPYGHSGAYATLEEVVRHHLDPVAALEAYDPDQVELPLLGRVLELTVQGSRLNHAFLNPHRQVGYEARDTFVQRTPEIRARIAAANELEPVRLTDPEVHALVAFLGTLTDPGARDTEHLVPDRVPSGLPVED
jgi:cytochrome c peroxidase